MILQIYDFLLNTEKNYLQNAEKKPKFFRKKWKTSPKWNFHNWLIK